MATDDGADNQNGKQPLQKLFRRLFILCFAFVIFGAAGSALFYYWSAGMAVSYKAHNRAAKRWVNSWDYAELKRNLLIAFIVSGGLGAASTFNLMAKSDSNDTDIGRDRD